MLAALQDISLAFAVKTLKIGQLAVGQRVELYVDCGVATALGVGRHTALEFAA